MKIIIHSHPWFSRWQVLALLVSSALGLSHSAAAQAALPPPLNYADQMPALPGGGGNVAVVAAIQKALVYPNPAGLSQTKGRAVVSIVVEADGSIREAKVVRSPSPSCEQPILAAVRRLPRFVPGRQNGQPVPVVLSLPIAVRLDSAVTAENTPPKSQ